MFKALTCRPQTRLLPYSHIHRRTFFNFFKRDKKSNQEPVSKETDSEEITQTNIQENLTQKPANTSPTGERQFVKNLDQSEKKESTESHLQTQETMDSELLMREEPTPMEIPKASEVASGSYKDPRLQEFEGTEKFKESLTQMQEFIPEAPQLTKFSRLRKIDPEQKEVLNNLIAYTNKELTMKFKREHVYNISGHSLYFPKKDGSQISTSEEALYKEVVFESDKTEFLRSQVKVDNQLKRRPTKIRNMQKFNKELIKNAQLPKHIRFDTWTSNKFEKYLDPYKYLDKPTDKQNKAFMNKENQYRNSLLFKAKMKEEIFLREIENRQFNPKLVPIFYEKFCYYRNIDNPADNMTIYRYPADKITDRGKIPTENLEHEQRVFLLSDLTHLYDEYALKIPAIKEFIEELMKSLDEGNLSPLYWFNINHDENYAAIVFDTFGNGTTYDIVIKDLKLDKLLPIIVRNSEGVVFDQFQGFYYPLKDAEGRAYRICRHQLGTMQSNDSLIYEETNPDFEVEVSSSSSNEYVFINIKSRFMPLTNEVWFKHTKDTEGDFSLISPMKYGINYTVKHSEQFFYKMTNEEDGVNYKITKIPLPSKYLLLNEPSNKASEFKPKSHTALEVVRKERLQLPGDKLITLPESHYFENRKDAIEVRGTNQLQIVQPTELIKTDYDAKLLDFEVTKHNLCVLEERNLSERLRILTLKNNRWNTVTLPEEYYTLKLEDNMTYNTQYLRYRVSMPHLPDKVNEHNMGTHKTDTIHLDHYSNFDPSKYRTEMITVEDCPIVLSYNVNEYNENSPFVLHTLGADSSKKDFQFDQAKVSLMDRGIVYAYPMVRGTKYLDDEWYLSGLNLRRIEHFLDVSIFLKEKQLTPSLGIYSEGLSGSVLALCSMLREPLLYDAISIHNPITDLTGYLNSSDLSANEKSALTEEFGSVENEEIYKILKLMNPYMLPISPEQDYPTDLLLTYDHEDTKNSTKSSCAAHSKKFIAKMREVNHKGDFMFVEELPRSYSSGPYADPLMQRTKSYSFLALSLLFRGTKEKRLIRSPQDPSVKYSDASQRSMDEKLKEYDM
ncbi:unnamed protein product [Moneuplotes crassus]|uniref:Prolyl endopeptidase-like n=1 Tax=Euplotes crassus TaxID=5936 RepID=A0AAD1UK47_EUPCR|nr:unnamed protein product [Moneuplotes crassus]